MFREIFSLLVYGLDKKRRSGIVPCILFSGRHGSVKTFWAKRRDASAMASPLFKTLVKKSYTQHTTYKTYLLSPNRCHVVIASI
jgi:hypothetical protein